MVDGTCRICLIAGGEALLPSPCRCVGSVHLFCVQAAFEERRCWDDFSCPKCRYPYEARVAVHFAKIGLREVLNEHAPEHLAVSKALANVGLAYGRLKDFARQAEYVERALEIDPSRHDLYVEAARAYGQMEDLGKQRELLEHAAGMIELHYGIDATGMIDVQDDATGVIDLASICVMLGDLQGDRRITIQWSETWENDLEQQLSKSAAARNIPAQTLKDGMALQDKNGQDVELSYDDAGHCTLATKASAVSERPDVHKNLASHPPRENVSAIAIEAVIAEGETHAAQAAKFLGNEDHADHEDIRAVGTSLGEVADCQIDASLHGDSAPPCQASEAEIVSETIEPELCESFPLTVLVQGDAERQKVLYERALVIREACLGMAHCTLVVPLTKLGNIWGRLGLTQRKHDFLERALNIQLKELGPKHREVAVIRFNLAHALYSLGSPQEAIKLMRKAKTNLQANFGAKHRHTQAAERAIKYWTQVQDKAGAPTRDGDGIPLSD